MVSFEVAFSVIRQMMLPAMILRAYALSRAIIRGTPPKRASCRLSGWGEGD